MIGDELLRFDAKLLGVDLSPWMAIVFDPRIAAEYSGSASVEAHGKANEQNSISFEADLSIPVLSHHRKRIVKDFKTRLTYEDGILRLLELAGGVAGGRVEAHGALRLASFTSDPSYEGELIFDAQRVQIDDLIRLRFPEYANQFGGVVNYRGSVKLNDRLSVLGDAHATNARWHALPIQNVHGDLRLTLERDGSLVMLTSRHLSGIAVGGNFIGNVEIRGNRRSEVRASGRVVNGKVEQLSKAMGFEHIMGAGRFEGAFDLGSRDAVSLSALALRCGRLSFHCCHKPKISRRKVRCQTDFHMN